MSFAAAVEQVATPVSGLDPVAVDVRKGEFADFSRHIGPLGRPVAEAGTEPVRTASMWSSRRSLDRLLALSRRPVGDGKMSLFLSAISRASPRTATARLDSGARCSSFAFMRADVTVQVAAASSTSCSAHPGRAQGGHLARARGRRVGGEPSG